MDPAELLALADDVARLGRVMRKHQGRLAEERRAQKHADHGDLEALVRDWQRKFDAARLAYETAREAAARPGLPGMEG